VCQAGSCDAYSPNHQPTPFDCAARLRLDESVCPMQKPHDPCRPQPPAGAASEIVASDPRTHDRHSTPGLKICQGLLPPSTLVGSQ
jgi:hypothetical protein